MAQRRTARRLDDHIIRTWRKRAERFRGRNATWGWTFVKTVRGHATETRADNHRDQLRTPDNRRPKPNAEATRAQPLRLGTNRTGDPVSLVEEEDSAISVHKASRGLRMPQLRSIVERIESM
jgi:hypothetical protein